MTSLGQKQMPMQLPTLSNSTDFASYRRRYFDILAAKHGQAGHAVVHDKENDHDKGEPIAPSVTDLYFNERTGEITTQPRFEWEKLSATDKKGKSEEQIAIIEAGLPLSSAGREDYRKEYSRFEQLHSAWSKRQTATKDHDDNCVTEMISSNSYGICFRNP